MTNERGDFPSASSLGRIHSCPASYLRGREAAKGLKTKANEAAESGERVHRALNGEQVALDIWEEAVVEQCCELEANLIEQYGFDGKDVKVYAEERLWLYPPDSGSTINLSGRSDKVYVDAKRHIALVIDYKSGRVEVEEAADNWQLAGYAVLEFFSDKRLPEVLNKIYVAIIQPSAPKPVSVTEYTADYIRQMKQQIEKSLTRAMNPHAKASAGEQCKYCPAHGSCGEAMEYVKSSLVPVDQVQIVRAGRKTEYVIPKLPPEQILVFLEKKPVLQAIIDGLYEQAKAYAEAGELEGYEMGAGNRNTSITDNASVIALLADGDVQKQRVLINSMTMSVGTLDAFAEEHLGAQKKNARPIWQAIAEGYYTIKPGAPQLKKVKE